MEGMYVIELIKTKQEEKLLDVVKNSLQGRTVLVEDFVWRTAEAAEAYTIKKYGADYGDIMRIVSLIIRESLDEDIAKHTKRECTVTTRM